MSVTSGSPYVEQLEGRRLFAVIDLHDYVTHYMNGDTKADLAVVTNKGLRLSTGNGDGSFTPAQNVNLPARPISVVAGDFNNDGKGDLIAQMPKGIIAILIGLQSTPTPGAALVDDPFFFDLGAELGLKATKNLDVHVGDVNNDDKDDIIAVDAPRGIIGVLIGQFTGTETFTYSFTARSPFGPGGRLAFGDANGDGRVDMVDLSVKGSVDVSLNIAGRFDDIDIVHVVGGGRTAPANVVNHVALGDVNGDGRDEIIAIANSGVRVFFMADDGEVEDVFNPNIGPLAAGLQSGLSMGDINGDGHDDLFAIRKDGRTRFFDIFAELP